MVPDCAAMAEVCTIVMIVKKCRIIISDSELIGSSVLGLGRFFTYQ